MREQIKFPALRDRIATVEEAAALIQNGMTVAMGGYSQSGYPKAIARELVRRKLNGEDLQINLITGANVGWLDETLGDAEIITRRAPMCANRVLAGQINKRTVHYVEQQMNKMPGLLLRESLGHIQVAVVEALGFTKEGHLIPTSSVGMAPNLLERADQVIVEINTAQPRTLDGMHDVFLPKRRPSRTPIPLISAGQRIGEKYIRIEHNKIAFIVESDELDAAGAVVGGTTVTDAIAGNLFNFLELEKKYYSGGLPPFQTGFGSMATSLVSAIQASDFSDIQFFCGGVGEPVLKLLVSGKAVAISTGGIEMTSGSIELLNQHSQMMQESCIIRNGEITNSAETIGRLGIIALNSAIEIDIYGNVNSSHIGGSRVINGLGGGANFAQNAGLSVMLLPSTGKKGCVSTIVPMVSHQDISEHDIDIVITECGVVDLRGLDDVERAQAIIENCAAEEYREQLRFYLEKSLRICSGHHPQLPEEAYSWHKRLKETGTMQM